MDQVDTTAAEHDVRAPKSLYIIGVLALLWNMIGCYDYLMTRMRNVEYFQSMMPNVDPQAMLDWVDAFPLYAQIGWAFGVWGGLVGSLLLLLRSRWAVTAFGLSLAGAVIGLGYQIVAAPPLPGAEGPMNDAMPFVIIFIALILFLYSRGKQASGVLR